MKLTPCRTHFTDRTYSPELLFWDRINEKFDVSPCLFDSPYAEFVPLGLEPPVKDDTVRRIIFETIVVNFLPEAERAAWDRLFDEIQFMFRDCTTLFFRVRPTIILDRGMDVEGNAYPPALRCRVGGL